MNFYNHFIQDLKIALEELKSSLPSGEVIDNQTAIETWSKWTHELSISKNTMYFIGNGASAMMAGHMSADATKNGEIKATCFNESSLMTAISNDINFEEVFSYPLKRFAHKGDILVTISSSGNSPNIIKGIEAAKELGLKIITLSGLKEENQSRKMGDLNFYVPAKTYGLTESAHQALLHAWLDFYIEKYL